MEKSWGVLVQVWDPWRDFCGDSSFREMAWEGRSVPVISNSCSSTMHRAVDETLLKDLRIALVVCFLCHII